MPPLYIAKGKVLFLQKERCKGCNLCIEICPTKCLESSNELNSRIQYPPQLVDGKECKFCELCEITCPDFSIYVVEESELEGKEGVEQSA
ncbi:MAG: 4Fe-4S binding protein [Candidatus Helarchaeota archaeon]|nr:4Fe-4S binding protein [Candidatus Helarchaeota archaeon]